VNPLELLKCSTAIPIGLGTDSWFFVLNNPRAQSLWNGKSGEAANSAEENFHPTETS
jgi:hypothetical protein